MSLWRQLKHGVRVLLNRRSADQELEDEARHYLDQSAAAFEANGLTADEARRAARMEMGNMITIREQVRQEGWESTIDTAREDLGYAIRRLLRNPGFTAVCIVTLTLGIGATAAIFSVINGVLLKPLPYPHPEQLVALWHTAPGVKIKNLPMAPSLYFTYLDESRSLQNIGLWKPVTSTVTGGAEPEEVPVLLAAHQTLAMLGTAPAIGRSFRASDDSPHSPRTVLLSNAYWRNRYGGASSALGHRIMIDGNAHEVIGVLPASFEFLDQKVSLVIPLRLNRAETYLLQFTYNGIARLKPGVSLEQANADLARCLLMAPSKFPINPGFSLRTFTDARIAPTLRLQKDSLVGDIGETLWVLMGAVGIVLLIACANVANLLLVRADGRQHELAIRAALGAGLVRIARELLLESLVLGVAGGLFGLGTAFLALRLLARLNITNLPRVSQITIDPVVVAFTFGVSIAAALIFGLLPVWKYAKPALSGTLRGGGRSMSQSKERSRARGMLVIVQVALAMILLVSSGLMIRTFHALRAVDPGFTRANELQTMHVYIPPTQVKEPERVLRMHEAILRKLADLPGVASAAIANAVPMESAWDSPVYVEDHGRADQAPPVHRFKLVSPGYFSTLGSRLIAGRDLTWEETYGQAPVALVSENMARELWHHPNTALGKRVRASLKDDWRVVIGVVGDLRDNGINQKAPAIVYWPLLLKNFEGAPSRSQRGVDFLIRTPRAGSPAFIQEIRHALMSVNANLPLANERTLQAIYEKSMARTSFTLILLGLAGSMALILGFVGIYGVISYAVSQRTREIGIRIALGATLPGVTGIFVRQGLILSGIGAILGLLAALALTRLMQSLLFGVGPTDLSTYATVLAALILAALLASWLPARRATGVDPMHALRAE